MRHDEELKSIIQGWRQGEPTNVIELGGLGEGYEIAIWDFAFDVLEAIIEGISSDPNTDWSEDNPIWERDKVFIEAAADQLAKDAGLSGAQYGAGINGATVFFRHGYLEALKLAPDRIITLSRINRQNPFTKGCQAHNEWNLKNGR